MLQAPEAWVTSIPLSLAAFPLLETTEVLRAKPLMPLPAIPSLPPPLTNSRVALKP